MQLGGIATAPGSAMVRKTQHEIGQPAAAQTFGQMAKKANCVDEQNGGKRERKTHGKSFLVDNGVVKQVNVEGVGPANCSFAENMLAQLG